ncbi:MAG: hypothetical protein M1814_002453 [Vezdaea aestivalis]|nr:MAG: hypothetical protein M1814_002453 [Vezdaea aestivalis]
METVKRRKLDHYAEQDESAKTSPILDNHKKTFRVTGIPASQDLKTLQQGLVKAFHIGENSDLIVHSLASDPCGDTSPQPRVATVTFGVLPRQLSYAEPEHNVSEAPPDKWSVRLEDELALPAKNVVLHFDTHFTGFTPLSPVEDDDKHVIDCIVIHGWGGHAFGSFKERDSPFMWLRDEITSLFPRLRIWLYGYDSKLMDSTRIESVDDWSARFSQLLVGLRARSEAEKYDRSLIFIVHSLGGWVFKETMVALRQSPDPKANNIVKCTYGALFFGVPSQGMDTEALATIIKQNPQRATAALLDEQILYRLRDKQNNSFCKAFNYQDSRIITFFETSESLTARWDLKLGRIVLDGPPRLLVRPESAKSGRGQEQYEDHIGIRGDHSSIVKFRQNDRADYQLVKNKLREFVENAEEAIRLRFGSQTVLQSVSKEEYKCLQTLYHSDYNEHKSRNPNPTLGTCEWVLRHRHFLQWKDQKSSSLLWLSADPGCGKSVLAKFLIDRLGSPDGEHNYNVCFFFFKDDNDQQKSAVLALRAILHQLFEVQNELLKHALPYFKSKGPAFVQEIYTLWEILIKSTIANNNSRETICIIDALDECEQQSRNMFMNIAAEFFKKNSGTNVNRPNLKLLITSRGYQDIGLNLFRPDHPLIIRLRAENEDYLRGNDVKLFVETRIQDICLRKRIPDETKSLLTRKVLENSDQTFLWSSLILTEIENSIRTSKNPLMNLIDQIPTSLDAVYSGILDRTNDRKCTKRLLHIVVGAVRPLSIREMNIALFIKPGDRDHADLDLEPVNAVENTIRNLCGLFIKVIDSRIYLIHQTARVFLIKTDQLASSESNLWKHSLNSIETECTLAEICVSYLMLKDFEDPSFYNQSELEVSAREYYFLEYVVANWASHFRKIQSEAGNQLIKSVRSIYDAKSARFGIWLRKYSFPWFRHRPSFTELTAASFFGHELIIRLLLENGADPEAKDGDGTTALHRAASNGHDAIVKLLLDKGADPEAKDIAGMTVLSQAASNGYEAIVKLLLDKGADTEAKDNNKMTALYSAASNGYETIMKLLLDKGADPEVKDWDGTTILSRAALKGYEIIVKLLLDKGVNTEAKDIAGMTVLSWAAMNGHETIVKLLLDKGADPEAKDDIGITALYRAATNGYETIVKLLLDKGANPEVKDRDGNNALAGVALSGHEVVIKLLLDKGADPEAKDRNGYNPLSWAALGGHEAVIKLLLDKGADPKARDRVGSNALSWAALGGYEVVVKLLLDKGADPEAKDGDGRTALHWAASSGHEAIVKLLKPFLPS